MTTATHDTTTRTNTESGTLTSADGTTIGWTRQGTGSPLVMVDCVLASRTSNQQPTLPDAFAEHFTVYTYDRRGKGESGSTAPYDVQREIEDLAALIDLAGGSADVYGFSSGATLALLAARAGVPVRRLALLEPPLEAGTDEQAQTLRELLGSDVPAALTYFYTQVIGVPEYVLEQLPPPGAEEIANAPTMLHELEFLRGLSADDFAAVSAPALIMASDQTAPEIYEYADQLNAALPDSRVDKLPGEWHGVDDETQTESLVRFLG